MESWFILLISIFIASLFKLIFNFIFPPTKQSPPPNLPPGPRPLPIIGNLLLFRKSFNDIRPVIQSLHVKFGPIITLHFGSRPTIFISDRFLAHEALVKYGSSFSGRPPIYDGSNQYHVTTAFYGPKWRLLRRNLTAEILQSSGLKTYSHAREWAMEKLLNRLKLESKSGDHPIRVLEHFHFSFSSLIVLMCFGAKYEDDKIQEIHDTVERLVSNVGRVSLIYMASILPRVMKLVFNNLLEEAARGGQKVKELFIPLIRERMKLKENKSGDHDNIDDESSSPSYIDRLMDIYLPEENRKLDDDELVRLCTEFISGGSGVPATALQWVMANVVKYPRIQEKLFMEIKGVVGDIEAGKLVKEDDLPRIPYLRAVVLEALRRHPLGPFLMPHAVTNAIVLNGYTVPRDWTVFIMNSDMGLDPTVWEDPMEFRPERFVSSKTVDMINGNGEVKMMPFGAGRRICPGRVMALLHLEYFVANLVWCFEWKAKEGDDVNMEPMTHELAITMKHPLRAHLLPRF